MPVRLRKPRAPGLIALALAVPTGVAAGDCVDTPAGSLCIAATYASCDATLEPTLCYSDAAVRAGRLALSLRDGLPPRIDGGDADLYARELRAFDRGPERRGCPIVADGTPADAQVAAFCAFDAAATRLLRAARLRELAAAAR